MSALVVRFLTELAAGETDAEGLKREERALRERIGSFRAGDRLAREAVHRRDLRMGRALPTPTSSSTPLAPATDIKWIATEHAMTISVGAKMNLPNASGRGNSHDAAYLIGHRPGVRLDNDTTARASTPRPEARAAIPPKERRRDK